MSKDIVWSGEEEITEPADGDHMEEEDAMIDRVVVSHDGDIIQWYCQVVASGPGSDLDQLMAKEEDPSQHVPADKINETSPTDNTRTGDLGVDDTDENTLVCDMDDDRGHVDEPVTREGHDIPTCIVQPGVEELVETAIAKNAEYPSDIKGQMPPLTAAPTARPRAAARNQKSPPTGKELWRGERGDEDRDQRQLHCCGVRGHLRT